MSSRISALFTRLTEERRSDIFWVLLLAGMIPALRQNLLFPPAWFGGLASRYALPAVENPFGLAAIVIALVIIGVALASRRRLLALAAVPFVALLLADSSLGVLLSGLNTVYVCSAFVAFLYFVVKGEALSLPFVGFLALLVAWQSFDDLLAWPQIMVFVMAALVGRLVVEAFQQNLPLARTLGRSNLKSLAGRTLSLWWPMLILIFIGLWGSNQITRATERLMYERGFVTPYCALDPDNPLSAMPCPEDSILLASTFYRQGRPEIWDAGDPQICRLNESLEKTTSRQPPRPSFQCPPEDGNESWSLTTLGFFDNLDLTVQRSYDIAEWKARDVLRGVDLAALQSVDRANVEARRLFSIVPASTGMKTSPCYEFPFVDCEAANIVIRGLNNAYKNARARTEAKFIGYIKGRAKEAGATVASVTQDASDSLSAELAAAEARTRQAIDRVHTAGNFVRQILLLWLIFVTVKSLLYVFARVIFDKSTDIDVDLLERDGVPAEGRVSHLQEVNIPGDYPGDIYYKANYQPLGPAARFSIPQWRASMMSRLAFGAWNMSRVKMPLDDPDGITFNSVEAEHLVDWELEEGEEVVFSYRNFVAMNDNIQLRTVISLRVATLLLGRIIFHTARCTGGPGRLILRTRGRPATAEQVRRSIPATRLIAWNRYARFSVDSHLTRADIFLNGFNLRRSEADSADGPQGILIVEADARDGGMLVGTLRFARNFLMPV